MAHVRGKTVFVLISLIDSAILETWSRRRELKKKHLPLSSFLLCMVLPLNQQHDVKVGFSNVIITSSKYDQFTNFHVSKIILICKKNLDPRIITHQGGQISTLTG